MKLSTPSGPVRGRVRNGALEFLGIPYAAPPTGERRFRAPEPVEPWTQTLDARQPGPRAPAPPQPDIFRRAERGHSSEDCLVLNIWTPAADDKQRPVLFWIHGGAFTAGSANDIDPAHFAATENLVVVSANYRLGIFGFFDLSAYGPEYAGSASNGLRDLIQALKWVSDNIADYGGSPNKVTICGQSAGGGCVSRLLESPAADGLYHGAIAMSPAVGIIRDQSAKLCKVLDINSADLPDKLLSLSTNELLVAQQRAALSFTAGRDGTVVTRNPEHQPSTHCVDVPIIAGTMRDEGTFFTWLWPDNTDPESIIPRLVKTLLNREPSHFISHVLQHHPQYRDNLTGLAAAIWTQYFRTEANRLADSYHATKAGSRLYRIDLPCSLADGTLGATHGADLPLMFNDFATDGPIIPYYDKTDADAARLALSWSQMIAEFARTGKPGNLTVEWPSYKPSEKTALIVSTHGYTTSPATSDELFQALDIHLPKSD